MTTSEGTTWSRRRWLVACGTGMGMGMLGLAGCAAVRDRIERDDGLQFDPGALVDLAERPRPSPPGRFPVAIPPAQIEHHRERTRALLDAVPTAPDLPNEAMAARLRRERQSAAEALSDDEWDASTGPLDRLDGARYDRSRAAEVRAAYRAATGDLDRSAVVERRGRLRTDFHAFVEQWAYRAPDPVTALVVHRELEALVRETRDGTNAWPPFPNAPRDAVFRVGARVQSLERGRAALEDAAAIRERVVDSSSSVRSYRTTTTGAATQLERDLGHTAHRMDPYLDADESPLDRDIDDTPAGELYQTARHHADGAERAVERAMDRDHPATAILRAGTGLTALETLESVVEAVEAGRYGRPDTANRVRRERERAVATLEHAWAHEPQPLSRALAFPALDALLTASQAIDRGSLGPSEVFHSYANYAHARHYAALVPAATDHVAAALHEPSPA